MIVLVLIKTRAALLLRKSLNMTFFNRSGYAIKGKNSFAAKIKELSERIEEVATFKFERNELLKDEAFCNVRRDVFHTRPPTNMCVAAIHIVFIISIVTRSIDLLRQTQVCPKKGHLVYNQAALVY